MDVQIDGHTVSVQQMLDAQQVVDRINKARQEVRQQAHIRALCRIAAGEWIERHPVKALYYQETRLA